ncbi:hypothetical protein RISK_003304 [Rhodopirellula islandica]|uniref:Uncharacterized protein n=1 Tax=Rhodopirellula islandica TaxID=595434 RepID=A0A0J1BDK6_RHOIS|nr:hypothetical protein RISK_003304 [Rhodopirellula islandica]
MPRSPRMGPSSVARGGSPEIHVENRPVAPEAAVVGCGVVPR